MDREKQVLELLGTDRQSNSLRILEENDSELSTGAAVAVGCVSIVALCFFLYFYRGIYMVEKQRLERGRQFRNGVENSEKEFIHQTGTTGPNISLESGVTEKNPMFGGNTDTTNDSSKRESYLTNISAAETNVSGFTVRDHVTEDLDEDRKPSL